MGTFYGWLEMDGEWLLVQVQPEEVSEKKMSNINGRNLVMNQPSDDSLVTADWILLWFALNPIENKGIRWSPTTYMAIASKSGRIWALHIRRRWTEESIWPEAENHLITQNERSTVMWKGKGIPKKFLQTKKRGILRNVDWLNQNATSWGVNDPRRDVLEALNLTYLWGTQLMRSWLKSSKLLRILRSWWMFCGSNKRDHWRLSLSAKECFLSEVLNKRSFISEK